VTISKVDRAFFVFRIYAAVGTLVVIASRAALFSIELNSPSLVGDLL
jgi:hypothetical protein